MPAPIEFTSTESAAVYQRLSDGASGRAVAVWFREQYGRAVSHVTILALGKRMRAEHQETDALFSAGGEKLTVGERMCAALERLERLEARVQTQKPEKVPAARVALRSLELQLRTLRFMFAVEAKGARRPDPDPTPRNDPSLFTAAPLERESPANSGGFDASGGLNSGLNSDLNSGLNSGPDSPALEEVAILDDLTRGSALEERQRYTAAFKRAEAGEIIWKQLLDSEEQLKEQSGLNSRLVLPPVTEVALVDDPTRGPAHEERERLTDAILKLMGGEISRRDVPWPRPPLDGSEPTFDWRLADLQIQAELRAILEASSASETPPPTGAGEASTTAPPVPVPPPIPDEPHCEHAERIPPGVHVKTRWPL